MKKQNHIRQVCDTWGNVQMEITATTVKAQTIQDRQSWLEQRNKGIGGSDASIIVGLNPYKNNVQLWEEKTGRAIADDISDKPYVQYGIQAENLLRALFQLDYPKYDVHNKEYDIIQHPEYPFLQASLDGHLIDKETGRRGVLEIKTTNILQSMQREKWDNRIPDNYYIQCLHYLLVTGYEFCILKAQLKTDWGGEVRLSTKHYTIERVDVEDDIQYLKQEEIKFWTEYVLKDKRPPLRLPEI